MKLSRVLIAAALAATMASQAQAGQWSVGAGVSNFDIEDVSLNAVDARVGYKVEIDNTAFSVMPELRLGVGAGDDTLDVYGYDVDVEIDTVASFGLRLGYDVTDSTSLFVEPALTKLKNSFSFEGESESETSDWEYGTGVGVAFNIGAQHGLDFSYAHYTDADVLSAAYRYRF